MALTLAPLLLNLPMLIATLALLPLCWQGWRLHTAQPQAASPWLLLLLAGSALAACLAEYSTVFGRMPGLAVLAMLVGLKLLESRSKRDGHVAIQLCFFLQLGYFLLEQSALTALQAGVSCLIALAALHRIEQPQLPLLPALRSSAESLLVAVPLALVLFLLFPRLDQPLWGLPADAFGGKSGLSERMSPGSIAELSLSGELAFTAEFDGAPPAAAQRYFRGPVLTHFDGREWQALSPEAAPSSPPPQAATLQRYTLTLEASQQRWLLALEHVEAGPGQRLNADYVLLAREAIRSRQRVSLLSAPGQSLRVSESPARLAAALTLPRGFNPRSVALGREIARKHAAPEQRLQALRVWLKEAQLAYTLSPPLLGQHTADEFLFLTRQGFCEHFSSAFVIVARAAGLPARVVTGYQGGEINPADATLVVRQSDAHAWAEVWLAEQGWLRVDPTAEAEPRRLEDGIYAAQGSSAALPYLLRTEQAWLKALRNQGLALSHAWNKWVLGYNAQRQRDFMQGLGLASGDWHSMVALLIALAALWQAAVFVLATQKQRRRFSGARKTWAQVQRHLKKAGLQQGEAEGPLDFAARVQTAGIPCEGLAELASTYAQLHYGAPPTPQALADFELKSHQWICAHPFKP